MTTFRNVIPVLVYSDIEAAHDFLVRTFGFESGGVDRDGDGNPVHGEVRAGEMKIWLHGVRDSLKPPDTIGVSHGGLVIHVDDVDAHFESVKSFGAQIERAPEDQPYGQREYGARDPEGHHWWFATPIE